MPLSNVALDCLLGLFLKAMLIGNINQLMQSRYSELSLRLVNIRREPGQAFCILKNRVFFYVTQLGITHQISEQPRFCRHAPCLVQAPFAVRLVNLEQLRESFLTVPSGDRIKNDY